MYRDSEKFLIGVVAFVHSSGISRWDGPFSQRSSHAWCPDASCARWWLYSCAEQLLLSLSTVNSSVVYSQSWVNIGSMVCYRFKDKSCLYKRLSVSNLCVIVFMLLQTSSCVAARANEDRHIQSKEILVICLHTFIDSDSTGRAKKVTPRKNFISLKF